MYAGVDPETGRRRYRTSTVRGTRAEAERELAGLVAVVRAEAVGGAGSPVSVLLERWFAVASGSWAPTTFGALSVLLTLLMGVVAVANATTAADPGPALLALFNGGW